MLRTIVKRDGSREAFDPAKLNKWALWSARHIRDRVDWSSVVTKAVKEFKEEATSQDLQRALIKKCVQTKRWPESLMAGCLYAVLSRKEVYPAGLPSVRKLQHKLAGLGLMQRLSYSDAEYIEIEKMVDHDRDFEMSYAQVNQIRKKYAVQNRTKKIEYETPQFVFIRMAMALAEKNDPEIRLERVQSFYDSLSMSQVNAPSPNYLNLGTPHNGYASCCLIAAGDTAMSIGIHNSIAYTMTYMSAGIGGTMQIRSISDPVRGGAIQHLGKMSYYTALAGAIRANMQAGRGGACTSYIPITDPEIQTVLMAQNPRTPTDKQNRDIHFAWQDFPFFADKVQKNEQIFLFNVFTAPDLFEAQFSPDKYLFEEIYDKYEADPNFKKTYISARQLLNMAMTQRNEVGTLYRMNIHEANRHTSYEETIRSSNLCAEIMQPTYAYYDETHLHHPGTHGYIVFKDQYKDDVRMDYSDRVIVERDGKSKITFAGALKSGDKFKVQRTVFDVTNNYDVSVESVEEVRQESEVSMCSLGGIVITKIKSDEEYYRAAYNNLAMIDECIHLAKYPYPHVGFTAKQRLNAGVGILGLAHHMALKGLKYDSPEGLAEIDRVAERHAYFVIKASLQLGKERGNAPWIHKTKWPQGWLPIDTYNRNVDEIVPHNPQYDWEALRAEIIANGGIRNSSLIAHMPTESSSKASGAPNSVYPVRDLSLKKTDMSNSLDWVAPDNDILEDSYQLAWEIDPAKMPMVYGVIQKWTDQGISADAYRDRTKTMVNSEGKTVIAPLKTSELIIEWLHAMKYGQKSQYYNNSYTGGKKLDEIVITEDEAKMQTQSAVQPIIVTEAIETVTITAESAKILEIPKQETQPLETISLDDLDGGGETRGCAGGVCTL